MLEGKEADVTFEGEKTKQKVNKFLDEYLYLKEGVKPDIGSKTDMRMKDEATFIFYQGNQRCLHQKVIH